MKSKARWALMAAACVRESQAWRLFEACRRRDQDPSNSTRQSGDDPKGPAMSALIPAAKRPTAIRRAWGATRCRMKSPSPSLEIKPSSSGFACPGGPGGAAQV